MARSFLFDLGRLALGRFVRRRCLLCFCRRVLGLARDGAGFLGRSPLVSLRVEPGLFGSDDGRLLRLFLLRLAGRLGHILSFLNRLGRCFLFLHLETGLFGPDGGDVFRLLSARGRLLGILDCLGHGPLGRPLGLSSAPIELALLSAAIFAQVGKYKASQPVLL